MLCGRMMEIAQEVAGAVPGLGAARVAAIEQVLDDLIRRYPLPALEAFYDCYLAWDDAFRAALKADPGRIPDMAVACYGAVCYVSYAVNVGEGESAGVRVYCEGVEDEFNAVVAGLAQKEPLAIMMKERDLLDLTMRFSRSLAREMQLLGRR